MSKTAELLLTGGAFARDGDQKILELRCFNESSSCRVAERGGCGEVVGCWRLLPMDLILLWAGTCCWECLGVAGGAVPCSPAAHG